MSHQNHWQILKGVKKIFLEQQVVDKLWIEELRDKMIFLRVASMVHNNMKEEILRMGSMRTILKQTKSKLNIKATKM